MWTMFYDTIYAFQDIDHDKQIEVNSSAIQFESNPKRYLGAIAATSLVSLTTAGYIASLGPIFYPFMATAALHMGHQVYTLDVQDKDK